jgi:BirA family biotin operon repressor/biotin-[acetyl-CoA-carboxylase] ligase
MEISFISREVVKSTNDEALIRIAANLATEGELICANLQEQGRGQGGNCWESEAGKNLLCSLILTPHQVVPAKQFILTQVVSLGVLHAIELWVTNEICKVKWPNDLYINDKKVGGILFQNIIKGHILDFAVAGIGVNVNQEFFGEDLPNAGSLKNFCGMEIPLTQFRNQVAQSIDQTYQLTYSKAGIQQINTQYLNKLYRINQWNNYRVSEREFIGMVVGIDEFGRLAVKNQDGQVRCHLFKEIEFVV